MKVNAILEEKFFFRTNVFEAGKPVIKELSIKEIFNGSEGFIGFKNLVEIFLVKNSEEIEEESLNVGYDVKEQVIKTLQFFCDLSKGDIPTSASILRKFVIGHPEYKKDSVLSQVT